MKKLALVLAIIGFLAVVSFVDDALALPVIDGIAGAGEWDAGAHIHSYSADDLNIPDAYDMKEIFGIQGPLGIYFCVDTYMAPTNLGIDTGTSAFLKCSLDYKGDLSNVDFFRVNYYGDLGVQIYSGSGTIWITSPEGMSAVDDVWEFYVPASDLKPGAFPLLKEGISKGIMRLDNNGNPNDDYVDFKVAPEPASVSLLGLSLLGLFGMFKSRFMA